MEKRFSTISKINILGFWSMVDFVIELSVGLVYVWYVGALEWDLCVREEQWFACWAHDPEIVSSSLTSNMCTFIYKSAVVIRSIKSKALKGYLNIKKSKDVTNEIVLTNFFKKLES